MFNVAIGSSAQNVTLQPPNASDLSDLQRILNQGDFVARNLPEGQILLIVQQICSQLAEQTNRLICHSVAKEVADAFCRWGWRRETGYLIKSSIDIDFLSQPPLMREPPFFTINTQSRNVYSWLHHHSVVVDTQGNYIECLPDYYPISEFIFIPHSSGARGYFLEASW